MCVRVRVSRVRLADADADLLSADRCRKRGHSEQWEAVEAAMM